MARGDTIADVLRALGELFSSLPAPRTTGGRTARQINRQIEENEAVQMLRTYSANVNLVRQLNAELKEYKTLIRGQNNVIRGVLKSPERQAEYEAALSKRSAREFARRQAIQDTVAKIIDPEIARKIQLVREYGTSGANQILQAEEYAEEQRLQQARNEENQNRYLTRLSQYEAGRKTIAEIRAKRLHAIWYDRLPVKDRELFDLTQHYGGGEEGRIEAGRAWKRKHDLAQSQKERALRLEMMKKFPAFFMFGQRSTKDIHYIAQLMRKTKGMPFGGLIRGAASSPYMYALGAVGAGIALTNRFLQESDKSNKLVTGWTAAESMYGKPTEAFKTAAMRAGITDPAKISQIYGQAMLRYGDAELFFKRLGAMTASVPEGVNRNRMKIAMGEFFGFDANTMMLADILAGAPVNEAQLTQARLAQLEIQQTKGFASGSSIADTLRAINLWIYNSKSLKARTGGTWLDWLIRPETAIERGAKMELEAHEAARSATDYERNGHSGASGDGANTTNNNQSNVVNINVNGVSLQQAALNQTFGEVLGIISGHDKTTLDALDSMMVA